MKPLSTTLANWPLYYEEVKQPKNRRIYATSNYSRLVAALRALWDSLCCPNCGRLWHL